MDYQMAKPAEKAARAYGRELRTSWKNAINICRAIQGMKVRAAEKYLEEVIALKRPVKFTVRYRKVAHKKGLGGPGRYPKKSAQKTLFVLKNAINNAEYQGLDPDEMVVLHASAYKGRSLTGYMPRAHGRASAKDEDLTNLEIIIAQPPEEKE